MASVDYIRGRWALNGLRMRPQAIMWSDNFGSVSTSASSSLQLAVPDGVEGQDFIILSDDNRSELSFSCERIENRQRMVNGTMRSYHIADKLSINFSWDMLPSRSFNKDPLFNQLDGKPQAPELEDYTSDGGAGGVDILNWYETHQGPFWMFLAYDKNNEFTSNRDSYLAQYNQLMQVYFSSFQYNVVKRGGTNFDFWNISVTLEEV